MAKYKHELPTPTPWGWIKDGMELTPAQVELLKEMGLADRIVQDKGEANDTPQAPMEEPPTRKPKR